MKKYGLKVISIVLFFAMIFSVTFLSDENTKVLASTVYNAESDFSSAQGYHQWYYQYLRDFNVWSPEESNFHELTWDSGDSMWEYGALYPDLMIADTWQHPDGKYLAVRTWEAPQSGTVSITGIVKKLNTTQGDGVIAQIRHNGDQIWVQRIEYDDGSEYDLDDYDLDFPVMKGDKIRFMVHRGWWYPSDSTSTGDAVEFNPTIVFTETTSAPDSFSAVEPTDGTGDFGVGPEFIWDEANGADSYTLDVDDNSDFSSPAVHITNITMTSYQCKPETLLPGTSYYWRVTAVNPTGNTVISGSPLQFTTGDWDLQMGTVKGVFLTSADYTDATNATVVLEDAVKSQSNPMMHLREGEWDDKYCNYGSILYDEEAKIFRMYYTGKSDTGGVSTVKRIAYAESEDGVNWTRPWLNIFSNMDNAITGDPKGNACVLHNPERVGTDDEYLMFCYPAGWPSTVSQIVMRYTSPDAIHWTWTGDTSNNAADTRWEISNVLYDKDETNPAYRWKAYFLRFTDGNAQWYSGSRATGLMTSPDGKTYTVQPEVMLQSTGAEVDEQYMNAVKIGQYYIAQFTGVYNMTGLGYPDPEKSNLPYNMKLQTELAYSTTGIGANCFTRVDNGNPIIELGDVGEADHFISEVVQQYPIRDGKIWDYYLAIQPSQYNWGIMLAKLRYEGWARVEPENPQNTTYFTTAVTANVPYDNMRLWINYKTIAAGATIKAALVDPVTGLEITGYTINDCTAVSGDHLRKSIQWGNNSTLPIGNYKIKFAIYNGDAHIYSWGFTDVNVILDKATSLEGEVKLDFQGVPYATSYKIKYGTATGSYTSTITGVTSSPYTVSGLTVNAPYYFVVTPVFASGDGLDSNEKSAVPKIMTHHAEDEFSLQQGRDGWFYQYWNGSSYSDMEWLGDYDMWQEPGSSRGCMIQDIYSRPDGTAAARKWVAPSDGTVLISGTVQKRNTGGNGVTIRILKTSTELWSQTIGAGDTSEKSFNDLEKFNVEEGDAIYFRVEGDDPGTDEVEFKPQVDFYTGMVTYNAGNDFAGTTQGINNWYYQYWDGDSYENMIWDSGTGMWKTSGNNCMIQAYYARPDGSDYSVRKWVAPADGSITVSGTVEKRNSGGNGVSICIKHEDTEKWRKAIAAEDEDNPCSYDIERFIVSAGDAVYFIVEGDNAYYDEVEMDPEIVFYSGETAYKASTGLTSTWGDNRWTYQYWDGGSYEDMVWNGTYNRWEKSGSSGGCMIQSVYTRPDGNYAVRKWTAPADGMVTITGIVKKRNTGGDGVTAKIKYGTTEKYSVSIAQADTSEHTYSPSTFYMAAGESLYFSVEGNDPYTDEVEFDPTVTFNSGLIDYQASTDYSSTQGTKHWSYQYWDGDSYENMEWSSSPARWIRPGSGGSCMIEPSYTRPDGNYAARKWTAPCDGIVTISGDVTKRFSGGDGVGVKIRRNTLELWSVAIEYDDTSAHAFLLNSVYVSAGDALYFSVEGNSPGDDEVEFDPLVSFSAN